MKIDQIKQTTEVIKSKILFNLFNEKYPWAQVGRI